MEYPRSFKVTIESDTNKQTRQEEFDNALDAVKALIPLLSPDELHEAKQEINRCESH